MNPDRRTVAGHTDDTEGEPSKGKASEVDDRMGHVCTDIVRALRVTQPDLYIGGMEVTELVTRLEETAKALTDMAEALLEMERTRRSGRKC